jgi:hypothetical protein
VALQEGLGDGPTIRRPGRGRDRKKLRSQTGRVDRFVYRLAAHLGIGNVETWKRELTLDQLHKWIAYYRVEPFGEDWLREARATMFTIAALGAKPGSDFVDIFLPNYDPDREMTEDEIAEKLKGWTKEGG